MASKMNTRRTQWTAGFGMAVLLVIAVAQAWNWNWFRPMLERQASAALGRKVTIEQLAVDGLLHPLIRIDGLVIANPEGFPAASQMASVDTIWIRLDPWTGLLGRLTLMELDLVRPQVTLLRNEQGQPNWQLPSNTDDGMASADSGRSLEIQALNIADGSFSVIDPQWHADFQVHFRTRPPAQGGEPVLTAEADGHYNQGALTATLTAGSLLSLRDPGQLYPIDLNLANGHTHAELKGTLQDPLNFGGAQLRLQFSGDSLSDLYAITGVPLAPTPPFKVAGMLDWVDRKIRFDKFSGTVGQSDLSGNVVVDLFARPRRRVSMDLHSDKVVFADLAGFVGLAPGQAHAPTESAGQKRQRAAQKKSGKVLSQTPMSIPRMQAADLDVHYDVARLVSDKVPVDRLTATLTLRDGVLSVNPLDLGMAGGKLLTQVTLDTRQQPVGVMADVKVQQLDLQHILAQSTPFKGVGRIGGSVTLRTAGNSMSQMMARGNGELKLFMSGGDLSALMVSLAGLDMGNAALSAMGLPKDADIHCMAADFALENGVAQSKLMLIDTTEANLIGKGSIDFTDESLHYELRTQPKRANLGSLAAPIRFRGTFARPEIGPDRTQLAVKGAAMVALGTLLTPLAALLPTLQAGRGEDQDCKALIAGLRDGPQAPADPPPDAAQPASKAVPTPR